MIATSLMSGNPVFADTSGFLALLDADDTFHTRAAEAWSNYLTQGNDIITSDYVRLESWALIQRRLGSQAALDFFDLILPICKIISVGETGFSTCVATWRVARRRNLSIVDITSFHVMRQHQITSAFTFDAHFEEEGFLVP